MNFFKKCANIQKASPSAWPDGTPRLGLRYSEKDLQVMVFPDQACVSPLFNNEDGFLQNDIQQLLEANRRQDIIQQMYYQSKLMGQYDDSSLPPDISDDDAFALCHNRYMQDPVELQTEAVLKSQVLDADIINKLENPDSVQPAATVEQTDNIDGL